jgi:hypothetical protein
MTKGLVRNFGTWYTVDSNLREDATACAVSGKPANPYGLLGHVFVHEGVDVACTDFARTADPIRCGTVGVLERAGARGWERDTE